MASTRQISCQSTKRRGERACRPPPRQRCSTCCRHMQWRAALEKWGDCIDVSISPGGLAIAKSPGSEARLRVVARCVRASARPARHGSRRAKSRRKPVKTVTKARRGVLARPRAKPIFADVPRRSGLLLTRRRQDAAVPPSRSEAEGARRLRATHHLCRARMREAHRGNGQSAVSPQVMMPGGRHASAPSFPRELSPRRFLESRRHAPRQAGYRLEATVQTRHASIR